MGTLLVNLCLKRNIKKLIPLAIIVGLAIDIAIGYYIIGPLIVGVLL